MNKAKLYKLTNTIVSLVVGVIAVYYLIDLLQEKAKEFDDFEVNKFDDLAFHILILVFILMPVNWYIETYKWMILIRKIQHMHFKRAVQSILIGILLGIISPNRIGELGGRLLHIKKENIPAAFYFNTICSFTQLLITLIIGLLAVLLNSEMIAEAFFGSSFIITVFSVIFIVILITLFFSSNTTYRLINIISTKIKLNQLTHQSRLDGLMRLRLLLMSGVRYLVFSIQFMLLLEFFGSEIALTDAFSGVALVFFATAIIPTAWISDLPVRSSIAFLVFETCFQTGIPALLSSVCLWSINLIFPALLSLFILPKVNWLAIKRISI